MARSRFERVVIACDCVVNPPGVETQLEGGMIYGLSAALFGEIAIKNGRVEPGNFDSYPVVRYKDGGDPAPARAASRNEIRQSRA
jgi:CO/xanthine dehydrogenase Mo-binding subunit